MKRLLLPVGALALALLIGAGALVARAKEPLAGRAAPNGMESIGSIDMEQVYAASGGPQELEQAARQHELEGTDRIKKVMAVPFLEVKELEEYGTLIGKDKMTPEEEKRAAALKAESDRRSEELTALEKKNELTDADKARMQHLNQARQAMQDQVRPGLIADFRAQQDNWMAAYRHQQLVQLRDEVGKAAKAKGISHVFESGTLVYSTNDLTSEVLQRLGKRGNKRPGN